MDRDERTILAEDARVLHGMGYAQELSRRMHGFSNFAISFSIICILAGGITAFQLGLSASGGFGIGVGWVVGSVFALIVSISMAQIASAYPTAGGLYHWAAILGGRGWGWATAWVNLLGLIFVVASVDVGVFLLFKALVAGNVFGLDTDAWGLNEQALAVALIAASQALFNHFGIKLTTLLTDFSGYLIMVVAVVLTATMLYAAPSFDFGRLFTFANLTGDAGGGVFPRTESTLMAFLLGLLLPLYTITGFDASAHVSEETVDARRTVPRGMINAVLCSAVFGYVMVCSFVLAMPSVDTAAHDGGDVFTKLLGGLGVPGALKNTLYVAIVLANYLCALAGMTSTSRMVFAFSRDGGLPASRIWRHVSPTWRTPVAAIWLVAGVTFLVTLYSSAFSVLATGCAVFLYLSYAMPIAAGLLAEGSTWTEFGPFRLGLMSRPLALVAVLGALVLLWIGIQPPNDQLIYYSLGLVVLLVALWFLVERRRFLGPPVGSAIAQRQAEIRAEEQAVGETIA